VLFSSLESDDTRHMDAILEAPTNQDWSLQLAAQNHSKFLHVLLLFLQLRSRGEGFLFLLIHCCRRLRCSLRVLWALMALNSMTNIKPVFCTAYCSKKCLLDDEKFGTALVPNCPDTSAPVGWCRNVLGLKCDGFDVS